MISKMSQTSDQGVSTRDAPLHLWNYKAGLGCLIEPLGQPWKIVRLFVAF